MNTPDLRVKRFNVKYLTYIISSESHKQAFWHLSLHFCVFPVLFQHKHLLNCLASLTFDLSDSPLSCCWTESVDLHPFCRLLTSHVSSLVPSSPFAVFPLHLPLCFLQGDRMDREAMKCQVLTVSNHSCESLTLVGNTLECTVPTELQAVPPRELQVEVRHAWSLRSHISTSTFQTCRFGF